MKMSRSIKDYKDAMDSVKISDSFYKRTEMLLNESSEMEVTKSASSKIRLVSRTVMAAAACLLVAFGIKTVVDNRIETDTAVVTEIITQETTVVTVPVTVPETASPVIDRPEEGGFLNDSGVIVGDMPEIPVVEAQVEEVDDSADETVAANPTAAPPDIKFTTDSDDDIPTVEEAEIEEAGAPKAPVETTATTAETTAREGYPEMAEPQGTENIPPLNGTATDEVSVEITPYFDLGAIRSGENPVSGSGKTYSELISTISAVTSVSPTAGNESFTSLFLIQLSEQSTGLPYYSIYVTDASTIVVTRHDIDNQKRFTYQLSDTDYDAVLYKLYILFGNATEYNYFCSSEVNS